MQSMAVRGSAILNLDRAKKRGASSKEIVMLASRAASLEKEMGENYLELGNSTQAAVIFAKAASYMKEAEEYSEAIVLLERAKEYAEEELKPSIDQELISLKSLEKGVLEKKAPEEILPKKKKAAPRKTPRKPVAKKTE